MDLSRMLELFGYSVYDPKIDELLRQCDAHCDNKAELKLYDSIQSESMGIEFWFWWKGYYQAQMGPPHGTVEPDDSSEVVLKEVRLTPPGMEETALPFGLHFPATQDSLVEALGRKPFSKTKNFAKEPVWTYFEDGYELLVIFEETGGSVRCFKIIKMKIKERQKIEFLESLANQKANIVPERISDLEARRSHSPVRAWERRMKSGDSQFAEEGLAASNQVISEYIDAICKATQKRNAKSLYTSLTKATKGFNKIARRHKGMIETMEREELVEFLHDTLRLTGLQFDQDFDLTEEHRSW